jgi:prepilin-type N-terminal cleavage/methylation domain-containing protein
MRVDSQRGVTLIELMIAVTLVAALMTGLLMVMRTGMITYEKLNHRLEDNRRVVGLQQALERQISGLIPVSGCVGPAGPTVLTGDAGSMRFISADSLAEGSRGYPRTIEYRAEPDPNGGVRLIMTESLYTGVATCGGAGVMPALSLSGQPPLEPVEMAGKLATCRFLYQEPLPDSPLGGAWVPVWNRPLVPRAVRIEMAPLDPNMAGLPALSLDVPLHITRQIGFVYVDE